MKYKPLKTNLHHKIGIGRSNENLQILTTSEHEKLHQIQIDLKWYQKLWRTIKRLYILITN